MKNLTSEYYSACISLTGLRNIFRNFYPKWIIIVLTIAITGIGGGCHSYFKVNSSARPSSESISSLDDAGKTIIVHFNNKKWILRDINIKDSVLTGRLSEYNLSPTLNPVRENRPNRYLTRATQDQRYLLNEVHLYIDEYADLGFGKVSIPVGSIRKMDLYDKDTATTVGSYLLGGLGITAGAFTVIGIIAILTKESCPFIYTWDGNDYHFAGEIYSGSIHKPLERNDYLKLPAYSGRQTYSLKITNEVREIQNTNLLELIVVDHPENVNILVDKSGKIQTLGDPVAPSTATNLAGKDVKYLLSQKDSQFYQSSSYADDSLFKDGVILGFPVQTGAKSARLAIRAKNSILLDYMMGQFHDLFGSAYHHYMKKQEKLQGAELRQMALERGIPLSVYIERDGDWEFVDYFNIAGPMAFKEDVLEIPLTGREPDPLRIKLEYGSFLWEIDYAAIDYSTGLEVTSFTVPVKTAFDEKQKDVSGLLKDDDNNYYVQPETDNQAIVTFDLPELTGPDRTVILHSKGWYQVIRDPEGKPEIEKLRAFRQPGHFNRFTSEKMKTMGQVLSRGQ